MRRGATALLLAGIALGLCAFAASGGEGGQDGRLRRSLRVDPPQMRSLELTPTGANTVRTVVEYAPDPRLGKQLTLHLTGGPVTFTRRDDGRYEADLHLSDEQRARLAARDGRIARLHNEAVHFDFDGRVLIGATVAAPLGLFAPPLQPAARGEPPAATISSAQAYLAVGALVPDPDAVLLITDRTVVADPDRTWDPCAPPPATPSKPVWTFGHLMKSLPGVTDPAALTEAWLSTWAAGQSIPGTSLTVPARPNIASVLSKWPRVNGALDLEHAPMRLLAIVNRMDLAENLMFVDGGGAPGSAGELRFVFDVAPNITLAGGTQECAIKRFQVIVEYRITASTCDEVQQWAQRWIDLGALGLGTPAYNAALAGITEDVVVNGHGALAQVRTNEIALADSVGRPTFWEMREFALSGTAPAVQLAERTVRRTPPDGLNRTQTLSALVVGKGSDILADVYELGAADSGANPQMDATTFWDGSRRPGEVQVDDPALRFAFSLNTCTGCHARETCTHFNHVIPGPAGAAATRSAFLAGGQNVPDPVFCPNRSCSSLPVSFCAQPPAAVETPPPAATAGTPAGTPAATAAATPTRDPCCYQPNDLERRRQVLDQLTMCIFPNGYQPLNAVH